MKIKAQGVSQRMATETVINLYYGILGSKYVNISRLSGHIIGFQTNCKLLCAWKLQSDKNVNYIYRESMYSSMCSAIF